MTGAVTKQVGDEHLSVRSQVTGLKLDPDVIHVSCLDNVNTHDKTGDACLVTIWELLMNHWSGTLFPFFAGLVGQG